MLFYAAAGAGCFSQPVPPSVYVEGVEVLQYDVDLRVDVERLAVVGSATITLVRDPDVQSIVLGLNGPRIDSAFVDGRRVSPQRAGAAGFRFDLSDASDTASVAIHYQGQPREGLYSREYRGSRIVYTDGWPHRVAGWLPGLHHPAHPARLDMTLRADSGLVVAGSGKPVSTDLGASRWHLDAPAPTYAYAFALAPYDSTSDGSGHIPITHYYHPADSASAADLHRSGDILAYFERLLGPYPYTSFSSVQVPFDYAGMENASAAFLSSSLYGTESLEEVLVHEIAHQWFGNDVAIADWRHLWISEGITTYLTTLFCEDDAGADAANEMRAEMATVHPDDETATGALVPDRIGSPYDLLTWRVYHKGAAAMHLLRLKMGDDAFFTALRSAYTHFRGRPASTEALLDHFRAHTTESLEEVIQYWFYGESLPRLATRWDAASQMLAWEVTEDDGTLEGVNFLLEVRTDDGVWYVDRRRGAVEVGSDGEPAVRPVGIMMSVE